MHFFKKQKKSCFGCFLHCSRKSCSLCFLLMFFVFPYMWFLLQQQEVKVMEDEDGSHVGWLWWYWHEWMVVGVKGVDDRAMLWRARPQVEMPWATVRGNMVENSGGKIQNIGRVLPALTLTALSLMLGTMSPILRFLNPNFQPSILSAMKIKEKEEELFLFNPTVISFEVY